MIDKPGIGLYHRSGTEYRLLDFDFDFDYLLPLDYRLLLHLDGNYSLDFPDDLYRLLHFDPDNPLHLDRFLDHDSDYLFDSYRLLDHDSDYPIDFLPDDLGDNSLYRHLPLDYLDLLYLNNLRLAGRQNRQRACSPQSRQERAAR